MDTTTSSPSSSIMTQAQVRGAMFRCPKCLGYLAALTIKSNPMRKCMWCKHIVVIKDPHVHTVDCGSKSLRMCRQEAK